mgnify:CR=1 FL=1
MVSLRAFWGEKGQKWAIKGKMKQWEYGGWGWGRGRGSIGGPLEFHRGSIEGPWGGSGGPYGVTVP